MNTNVLCDEHKFHMFITLRRKDIYFNDMVVFITLRRQDIVCHIMMIGYFHHIGIMRICSSHCDNEAMFVTLWKYGYVHHIVTMN
jgi:hypothetical protein